MLNSFSGVGRLVGDPLLVHKPVRYPEAKIGAQFMIAMNKFLKVEGELMKETVYIPCVTFNRLAEITGEFLCKGSQIGVTGTIEMTKGKSLNGEECKSTVWVIVKELEFLSNREGDNMINLDMIPQYKRPSKPLKDKPARKLRLSPEATGGQ